jgi:hypothetical protein
LDSHIPIANKEIIPTVENNKHQNQDMPVGSYRSPDSSTQRIANPKITPKMRQHPRLKSSFKIEKNLSQKTAMPSEKAESAATQHVRPSASPKHPARPVERKPSIRSDWKTTIPSMPISEKKKETRSSEKRTSKELSDKVTPIPGNPNLQGQKSERRKPREATIGLKTKIPAGGLAPRKPRRDS